MNRPSSGGYISLLIFDHVTFFLYLFKSLKGVAPNFSHDIFKQYSQTWSLRHKQLLLKPTVRTKQGEATLAAMASIFGTSSREHQKRPNCRDFYK